MNDWLTERMNEWTKKTLIFNTFQSVYSKIIKYIYGKEKKWKYI